MFRHAYAEILPNGQLNTDAIRGTRQDSFRASKHQTPDAIRKITLLKRPETGTTPVWAAIDARGKIKPTSVRGSKEGVMAAYATINPLALFATTEVRRKTTRQTMGSTPEEILKTLQNRLVESCEKSKKTGLRYAKTIGRSWPCYVDKILETLNTIIEPDQSVSTTRQEIAETISATRNGDVSRNSRTKKPEKQQERGKDLAKIILSTGRNPDNTTPPHNKKALNTLQAIAWLGITTDEFERWTARPDGLRPSFLEPVTVESGIIYNRRRWILSDLEAFAPRIMFLRIEDATPKIVKPEKRKRQTKKKTPPASSSKKPKKVTDMPLFKNL